MQGAFLWGLPSLDLLDPPQSQHFLDYQNINLAINLRANVQQNGNLWKKSTHELSGK